jgi:hypothetical protein
MASHSGGGASGTLVEGGLRATFGRLLFDGNIAVDVRGRRARSQKAERRRDIHFVEGVLEDVPWEAMFPLFGLSQSMQSSQR